jgi:signal transduction histidine kinase
MRRLLGAMRERGREAELGPQPGLENLGALVHSVRTAGLPVRLDVEGDPIPLPRALDLSAYRIVQEGLTNVLKHADASHAEVVVRHRPDALQLEVRDDGRGPASSDGLGHGLVGIRERVNLYGGDMTAGPANGGGFVLSASLRLTDVRR